MRFSDSQYPEISTDDLVTQGAMVSAIVELSNIYEDLGVRSRYISNFEQNEILVSGHLGVWHLVFHKSRYLNGIYLFSYSVLKKKGHLRNRREVWCQKQVCHAFPFAARLRYQIEIPLVPLAPKDCLSMQVGRRYLPLAHKKSCVVFLLNNVTLGYPPLALGLKQEADCNI